MVNGKDLREFQADLEKFAKAIDVPIRTAFKKIVFECWTRIIMKSPVDTGRFRASWTLQETTPKSEVKPEGVYSSPPLPEITFQSPFTIMWINNSLPYAVALETGHSKQAPAGVVAVTAAEMAEYINNIGRYAT